MDNTTFFKEGYIPDLATGKPVDGTKPEENVRQEYELILHENYSYAYGQMDIEVKIQRGEIHNKKNEKERADIPAEIRRLIAKREKARKTKDWKKADEIRKKINNLGYILEDTKEGTNARKKD